MMFPCSLHTVFINIGHAELTSCQISTCNLNIITSTWSAKVTGFYKWPYRSLRHTGLGFSEKCALHVFTYPDMRTRVGFAILRLCVRCVYVWCACVMIQSSRHTLHNTSALLSLSSVFLSGFLSLYFLIVFFLNVILHTTVFWAPFCASGFYPVSWLAKHQHLGSRSIVSQLEVEQAVWKSAQRKLVVYICPTLLVCASVFQFQ